MQVAKLKGCETLSDLDKVEIRLKYPEPIKLKGGETQKVRVMISLAPLASTVLLTACGSCTHLVSVQLRQVWAMRPCAPCRADGGRGGQAAARVQGFRAGRPGAHGRVHLAQVSETSLCVCQRLPWPGERVRLASSARYFRGCRYGTRAPGASDDEGSSGGEGDDGDDQEARQRKKDAKCVAQLLPPPAGTAEDAEQLAPSAARLRRSAAAAAGRRRLEWTAHGPFVPNGTLARPLTSAKSWDMLAKRRAHHNKVRDTVCPYGLAEARAVHSLCWCCAWA